MDQLNKNMIKKPERPVRVIQFGEGNFLRGFVDYMIDIMNEKTEFNGNAVLIKPIEHGNLDLFRQQDSIYTVSLRGLSCGEEKVMNRIITSVSDAVDPFREYERYAALAKSETLRFVVSNTTEAGIIYDENDRMEYCPPKSYPGKLLKFLYERYCYFNGAEDKGLILLPVELIDDNGRNLKKAVIKLAGLWKLEEGFISWMDRTCVFCSTLVDRIITGFPKEEAPKMWENFHYKDNLIVTGEPFALWVIESSIPVEGELPFRKAGLPVVFTNNLKPYKQRKVRILNGAHTSFALLSYLSGNDTVLDSMQDDDIYRYFRKTVYEEIIPTLSLPEEDLISFADNVIERFKNPYIKHKLLSISLNSVSKWKTRCLPSLKDYVKKYSKLPDCLTFSLAALMVFYSGKEIRDGVLIAHRDGLEYMVQDDRDILEYFAANSDKNADELTAGFLSKKNYWGEDLTKLPHFAEQVEEDLQLIKKYGIRNAVRKLL